MTKFDELKEHGAQYMATELCVYISDHVEDCEQCPFTDRCSCGRNGVLDYLMEKVEDLPTVSVAKKVGTDHWEKLWDELYDWLNDTRLNVAPDETVKDDVERNERLAQADMLDEVMECMLDLESRREEGETDG